MIIGVTGATKVGKSTFINDFIDKYDKYGTPIESYRDIPDLDLYDKGTEKSQRLIRDFMFKQVKDIWNKRDTQKSVILDRTLLDNLACTLFLYAKDDGTISDAFVAESFDITRKAMAMYHLIYFVPITEIDKIPVPEEIDLDFRMGFDTILKTFYNAYLHRDPLADDIFPKDKCAAVDQIIGNREERIELASEILNEDGEVQGGFDDVAKPMLYDQHGRDINTTMVDGGLSLEDFGFTEEEINNQPAL